MKTGLFGLWEMWSEGNEEEVFFFFIENLVLVSMRLKQCFFRFLMKLLRLQVFGRTVTFTSVLSCKINKNANITGQL